ncbi:HD domain-containing protein [Streptomyces bomunensis]|uniref:HD domain-containing protein n=1 Tax=Streptomyces montanisoli TaxID=2798581 RepID=A0A940S151_9ACTN|nr:HD domain-containing protein [Streptomyces montanisoli]
MGPVPTSVAAVSRHFTDPLWGITVHLTPVEADLLHTAPLRRLHFVAHGGASALTTLQSYSRLEHTLGVLALTAHFHPGDELLRTAALLHDIGHLPLSHTLEGTAGLDHHSIGAALLRTDPVRAVLGRHGIAPEAVTALLDGTPPSPLAGDSGLLNLDHLDSYVRSGRSAGRLAVDPAHLLGRLGLAGTADTAVTTDRETAGTLVGLVRAEAQLHTSWDNVAPTSVARRLARQLLDGTGLEPARLARMTDNELWSALDAHPPTRPESAMLRGEPHRLRVAVAGTAESGPSGPPGASGWDFALRKIYSSAPLVDGRRLEDAAPGLAAGLRALDLLPTTFRVWWA